ncbi:MAG: 23S rRNA (pseudouridine(1915)-N(3))-methyltransferase RlmH, partial [Terriglobia bacterium]
MRIQLVLFGRTRNPHLRALIEDYRARIARFTSIDILEWKSTDGGPGTIAQARGKGGRAPVILLDASGKAYTSEEFARWLAQQINAGRQKLIFL